MKNTEWTPQNLAIAGSGVLAVLLLLPNLGKGWDALKYAIDAIPTAYAAKQQSAAVQSEFDRYLESQQQVLEKQQAVADAINAYVQQQLPPKWLAAPNEQTDTVWREIGEDGRCWRCFERDYPDCWEPVNRWVSCE